MNNIDEVFKHYLHDYQKPVFDELLTAGNKKLFSAPMDFGKTYLGCANVSYLFETKQIRSATFSIPNYEMRRKVISDLKAVGMKDAVIVCPEGMEKAFRSFKKKRVSSLDINKNDLKGKTIDLDYVQKRWPKYNPYYVLIHLQKYADVIILHHSLLKTNKKLKKTDLLIIDDGDLMNRDSVFLIARYKVYKEHLQADDSPPTDFNLKKIRQKVEDKKNTLVFFNAVLDQLSSLMPQNPKDLESASVVEMETHRESPLLKDINEMVAQKRKRKLTDDEKNRKFLSFKRNTVELGISQVSNPVKWDSLLNKDFKENIRLLADDDDLKDEIDQEIKYAVSLHIDYRMEDFLNALMDPEFHIKLSQIDTDWSTLEIYLRNGSNFMDVVNQYHRVLWISATADPESPEFKEFKLIKSTVDPNAEYKHVRFIEKEKIPDLLSNLKNHNVFVVANSEKGAKEFIETYGCGEILKGDSNSIKAILQNAKNSKGIIEVAYVNHQISRGSDDLADSFDTVILDSWIYKSVMQESGKFYGENHMWNNRSDAIQIIGRIMRGSKYHVLFVIKDDKTGKISEFLKEQNPSWNYGDGDYKELISKIPERIPKEPTQDEKLRLHKETRTLKDGSKELVYRQKATDEEIENAPDFIEL